MSKVTIIYDREDGSDVTTIEGIGFAGTVLREHTDFSGESNRSSSGAGVEVTSTMFGEFNVFEEVALASSNRELAQQIFDRVNSWLGSQAELAEEEYSNALVEMLSALAKEVEDED